MLTMQCWKMLSIGLTKQYENGVRAGQYLIAQIADGGKVVRIEGQAGV